MWEFKSIKTFRNQSTKLLAKCEIPNQLRHFENVNTILAKFDEVIFEYILWIQNFKENKLAYNASGYKI